MEKSYTGMENSGDVRTKTKSKSNEPKSNELPGSSDDTPSLDRAKDAVRVRGPKSQEPASSDDTPSNEKKKKTLRKRVMKSNGSGSNEPSGSLKERRKKSMEKSKQMEHSDDTKSKSDELVKIKSRHGKSTESAYRRMKTPESLSSFNKSGSRESGSKEMMSKDGARGSKRKHKKRSGSNSSEYPYPKSRYHETPQISGGYPYPYPYPHPHRHSSSYPNKSKRPELRWKDSKPKTCMERAGVWVQIALMIIVAVNCMLAYAVVHFSVSYNVEVKDDWEFLPLPRSIHYKNFVMVSSSEICNEIARMVSTVRQPPLGAMAAYMSICHAIAEPHNSGLGGHSLTLVVDAKKETCYQTQGHYRLPQDFSQLGKAMRDDATNVDIGYAAFAMATDIRNIIGLLQVGDVEVNLKVFKQLLLKLKEGFKHFRYKLPVSASLAKCFYNPTLESPLVFSEDYEKWRGEMKTPLNEGDFYNPNLQILEELLQMAEDWLNGGLPQTLKTMRKLTEYMLYTLKKVSDTKEALTTQEIESYMPTTEDLYMKEGKITKINGHLVCTANYPNSSSVLANALKKYEDEFAEIKDPLTNPSFYETYFKALDYAVGKLRGLANIVGLELHGESKTELLGMAQLTSSMDDSKRTGLFYGANMYAMIDVKTQTAVTFVGSLGASFGNTYFDKNKTFPLNNLLSNTGRHLNSSGFVHHTLQPLIAMKDGKISLAMTGPGGVLGRSLDMARTFMTAVLTLIKGIPAREAVTTPLIFPTNDKIEYTHGFSYKKRGEITASLRNKFKEEWRKRPVKREDLDADDRRLDRAAVLVSDVATGFFFDDRGLEPISNGN